MMSFRAIPFAFVLCLIPVLASAGEKHTEDSLTIGPRFHYETSYGDAGLKTDIVGWGSGIPLYKEYPGAERVALPGPSFDGLSVEEAIRKRHSRRGFSDQAIGLDELSQMLLSAGGITGEGHRPTRAAPSGGALYPIDIYVFCSQVETLEPGLYHFRPKDTSLELVYAGDYRDGLHAAANSQNSVGGAPVTIVLTARFDRITRKYADRGYRYAYIEAGAICQNVYLQAESLALGTCAVGAFNDDALNELLNIDGISEAALLIMPLGHRPE